MCEQCKDLQPNISTDMSVIVGDLKHAAGTLLMLGMVNKKKFEMSAQTKADEAAFAECDQSLKQMHRGVCSALEIFAPEKPAEVV